MTLGRLLEAVLSPQDTWSNLPLSFALEILPRLSPRYYSISPSSIVSPKQIAIPVATCSLHAQTHPFPGFTTNYLTCLGRKINDSPTQYPLSTYDLPSRNNLLQSVKIFAHVQERARFAMMGRPVGPAKIFFGCRSASSDYLYQDELTELQSSLGDILEIFTAFLRTETSKGGREMPVQDRVQKHEEVVRLQMEENGYFYVCGSADMTRDLASVVACSAGCGGKKAS